MKKITTLTFLILSSAVFAKNHHAIHVQHHGKMADIPDHAPVMTHQAAATRHAIRVNPLNLNQRGVAHITGSIRGLGMAAYRFYGQAGQQVRITPIGNNYSMLFGLFDENRGMNFGTTHILPTTGEYEVRIVQTRKNAARNRHYYRYNANVYLGHAADQYVPPSRKVHTSTPPKGVIVQQQQASRHHSMDNYQIAPNTTPDGSRRVVPTSTPLNGERSGKISALPRREIVEEKVVTRHINYHSEPVISYLKSDQKTNKKPSQTDGKKLTKNYRCQSGGSLKVTHNGAAVTVKHGKLTLHLQKNDNQSYGNNQIYTGKKGFLHLVKTEKSPSFEVLSFEYQGKTLAFGCK